MAYLHAVHYYLPETRRTNEDLVRWNPHWHPEKIFAKTGIRSRPVVVDGQTATDLGYEAAERLLAETGADRTAVDAILFCTQSPDYFLPSSACLLQDRLGLSTRCAAFDYNLGCSGFTYGLWLAKALIASESAENVLLVVGETYSKYCNRHDLITSTIFGDGAAAALVTAGAEGALASIGPTVLGTDGRGAGELIVRAGAARVPYSDATAEIQRDHRGNQRTDEQLWMNGPEIYGFTLTTVHEGIEQLLDRTGMAWDDVDLFLMHQANRFMLEKLRQRMGVAPEKMPIDMEDVGNTVSASIPILICRCRKAGLLRPNQRCVLAGFGVGYSWAMTSIQWLAEGPTADRPRVAQ